MNELTITGNQEIAKCDNQKCAAYTWNMTGLKIKNHCTMCGSVTECSDSKLMKKKWVPKPGELIYVWSGCNKLNLKPRYVKRFYAKKGRVECYSFGCKQFDLTLLWYHFKQIPSKKMKEAIKQAEEDGKGYL